MILLGILTFGLTIWLAAYVLHRSQNEAGWFSAAALAAYATAIALTLISAAGEIRPTTQIDTATTLCLLLAVLLWTRAVIALLPRNDDARWRLVRVWKFVLLPLTLIAAGLIIGADSLVAMAASAAITMLPALIMTVTVAGMMTEQRTIGWITTLLIFTVLFLSSATMLLLRPLGNASAWLAIGAGLDLCVLGIVVAGISARQAGEKMMRDFMRSFDAALIAALLFSLPLVLAAGGIPAEPAELAALLTILALAIGSQALVTPWQRTLDRITLRAVPAMQAERQQLRATAEALPRRDDALDPETLDETEFVRLTRRALGNYANLPKLTSSPLTQLAIVRARLDATGAPENSLARAAALRDALGESIAALRPYDAKTFQAGDDWRYYNALYYPYVVGIKPYSRRADHGHLDENAQTALTWFRTYVPERTLYNWQNAAAALVAQHLREL